MEILDFEGIFHECYCVFGSCSVMLMGGGLAPFADVGGGSARSSAGWLGGRPLCVWFFSDIVGCGVVFFDGAVGGGVLVRAALYLFVVIDDEPRGVGCLVAFFLSKSFFFFNVFDNSFLRLRCTGVLSLEGFESVFYWDCHWLRASFLFHIFAFFVALFF